jgi:hypothetical protein
MRTRGSAQRARPLTHLVSRFVGKSYRANIARANARIYQGCDSIRDDGCFSAAGAGDDKQRTFKMVDRFYLGRCK